MIRYIYVQAFQDGEDVCFRHVEIEATDADDAYAMGARLVDLRDEPGQPLNDYVIALGPALRAVR